MGQTLSEPVVEKHTSEGSDSRISWAASAMQAMEDAHTTLTSLENFPNHSVFAVYDGHGGSHAAKYAGTNLHVNIATTEEFKQKKFKEALKIGFLKTDDDLRKDAQHQKEPSGCTAVLTLVTEDNTIYCANSGDSRAVLSDNGLAVPLSTDHKPVNPGEYARISAAGGFVEFGRVNGNLALSRAIGDFEFKNNNALKPEEQIVTADPEITVNEYKETHEFFIVACDGNSSNFTSGIWDVLSSQQAIDFVATRIAQGLSIAHICEAMTQHCLAKDAMAGIGCDNMTVVICALCHGKTELEWREQVTKRVNASMKEDPAVDNSTADGLK